MKGAAAGQHVSKKDIAGLCAGDMLLGGPPCDDTITAVEIAICTGTPSMGNITADFASAA